MGPMWTRVAWAAATFAGIMGFSRLSYGVLVPDMRAALGGSFALYGAIGTANMIGYLAGSLLTTGLARRPDRSRINTIALVAMCLAMGASGFVVEPLTLGFLRFAVGLASGIALALTLALAVEKIPPARRGVAAAIIWGGACAGIALVGAASGLVAAAGPNAWRIEWVAMGIVGLLVSAVYAKLSGGAFAAAERRDDSGGIGLLVRSRYRALTIAYFAFGVGYIDIVTFLGAALGHAGGMSAGTTWCLLGIAGLIGVTIWGPLVDRLGSGIPVAIACLGCAGGAGVVAFAQPAALAGEIAIGISFIGVPAMVGALMQQRESGTRYPRAFASMTVVLGVGQIIGPLAGGFIADRFGTPAAIAAGGCALAIAALAAAFYRKPLPERGERFSTPIAAGAAVESVRAFS